MIDLSFIVVNYNTKTLACNSLESIYRTVRNNSFEIIFVDNASSDGSADYISAKFPDVKLIANKSNLGFAAANNQAIKLMRGRYALLLNSDTILTENAIAELVSFMDSHSDAAMACGQLLNSDNSKQNSIAKFPSLLTLMVNISLLEIISPKFFPSKRYSHSRPVEIDSGIGACLIVRKAAIDEVGMLDERYFFFFEETDWALQMKKAGWKTFFVPSARIYHLQGQSIGGGVESRKRFYKSRYLYFKKWKSSTYYHAICSLILFRLFMNWIVNLFLTFLTLGLAKKLRDKTKIYSDLLRWHIKDCPAHLK